MFKFRTKAIVLTVLAGSLLASGVAAAAPVAAPNPLPSSTTGKVYVRMAGETQDRVCAAVAVSSTRRKGVVATAAHCVLPRGRAEQPASVVFRPGFGMTNFEQRFKVWTKLGDVKAHPGWNGSSILGDVATFAVTEPGGGNLGGTGGAAAWAINGGNFAGTLLDYRNDAPVQQACQSNVFLIVPPEYRFYGAQNPSCSYAASKGMDGGPFFADYRKQAQPDFYGGTVLGITVGPTTAGTMGAYRLDGGFAQIVDEADRQA
ncbi:hypothetical protein D5S17_11560 [Pseudonocardiaceae bacterium YIM PH 21723]|nr:hypothetical protein D5S17_11560 [Pseudonocardiaceae bacterium YIM PH 21723]